MSLSASLISCTALMTNTIMTQLLCESELGNDNNLCCFPKFSDGAPLCPTTYFLIQNNSKVICSREGKTEAMFNTLFSEKSFCTRTCPVGFQASVLASVLTCIPCDLSCNDNTTETKIDPKELNASTIPIVLSSVSLTVCCLVLAVICFLYNKRLCTACGQGQTSHISIDALEMVLGNKIVVKPEDLDNVDDTDGGKRMVNGYVRDPTININRGDGIDNDSYDYAEERIVPRGAYIQKISHEDDDDGDGYQEYTGPAAAVTKQEIEDIYVNQTVTTEYQTHDKTSQRQSSDNQKTENSHQKQALSESCNHENIENEDSFYVNQSIKQCTDYENVNIEETYVGKMMTVLSNNVSVNTVNKVTAVNTSTITVGHADNMNIHNITVVNFTNVIVEKPAKESDKKLQTW